MKWLFRFGTWLLICGIAVAQVQVPEGTRLRVRLEEDLSSATAQEGQLVQLSVMDEVKVGSTVVIAAGAAVAGKVILATPRKLTTSGKLDFSAVAVIAADGQPIPLRYGRDKTTAGSNAARGLIGAGATILFGPTVTMLRMMRAKDITLERGTIVEVFTDQSHVFKSSTPAAADTTAAGQANGGNKREDGASQPVPLAVLSISSTPDGAKITVDGTDIGKAPASFQVDPGDHAIQIEKEGFAIWKRKLTAEAGTPIDLDVKLEKPSTAKPASPKPAAAIPAGAKPVTTAPKAGVPR